MKKFESDEDPDFTLVFSEIRRWVSDIEARQSMGSASPLVNGTVINQERSQFRSRRPLAENQSHQQSSQQLSTQPI
jgi:hypothetical protein